MKWKEHQDCRKERRVRPVVQESERLAAFDLVVPSAMGQKITEVGGVNVAC